MVSPRSENINIAVEQLRDRHAIRGVPASTTATVPISGGHPGELTLVRRYLDEVSLGWTRRCDYSRPLDPHTELMACASRSPDSGSWFSMAAEASSARVTTTRLIRAKTGRTCSGTPSRG